MKIEATEINLLNGQLVAEGCELAIDKCRVWSASDESSWPQARRQIRVDQILVVDQDGVAYFVVFEEFDAARR